MESLWEALAGSNGVISGGVGRETSDWGGG